MASRAAYRSDDLRQLMREGSELRTALARRGIVGRDQ
jgi:hypothetical protein